MTNASFTPKSKRQPKYSKIYIFLANLLFLGNQVEREVFYMELTPEQFEELKEQIKAELTQEMMGQQTERQRNPVRRAMKSVQCEYEKKVQELAGSYVWTQIQRIACLMNGYSQQRWVQDTDAEKVANTAKELCESIIKGFEIRKEL